MAIRKYILSFCLIVNGTILFVVRFDLFDTPGRRIIKEEKGKDKYRVYFF